MVYKPIFIETPEELQKLTRLRRQDRSKDKPFCVDAFSRQIKELFLIENPKFSIADKKEVYRGREFQDFAKKRQKDFTHVYFPWNNNLVKCVREADYFKLKTNRNKDIITGKEQRKLADFTVGIVGLSVGANIATALIHSGFSKNIKISDFDELD